MRTATDLRICLALGVGLLATASGLCQVPAGPASLVGRWENIDGRTRSIPFLEVRQEGERYLLHVWGACHPTPCDWGELPASSYASEVGEDPVNEAVGLTAMHRTGFSETLLTLKLRRSRILEVDLFDRFLDRSGRSPTVHSLRMLRRNPETPPQMSLEELPVRLLDHRTSPPPAQEQPPAKVPSRKLQVQPLPRQPLPRESEPVPANQRPEGGRSWLGG